MAGVAGPAVLAGAGVVDAVAVAVAHVGRVDVARTAAVLAGVLPPQVHPRALVHFLQLLGESDLLLAAAQVVAHAGRPHLRHRLQVGRPGRGLSTGGTIGNGSGGGRQGDGSQEEEKR